jgi:hypothetical protein
MSNSTDINWAKPAAFAAVITGKQVKVLPGDPGVGPHTNGRSITMGCSVNWDEQDRFAILVHECCHLIFPANYPGGNIRELANLIDDCRIERQFLVTRPHYEDVLSSLAINVIANGCYSEDQKDHWSPEHFEPSLWALLFFRPHCGDEVRLAAADAINAYAAGKGYDKQDGWKDKFAKLVEEGQRITRLKTVSKDTLEKWCLAYFDAFPEAKKNINSELSVAILKDQPAPKGEPQDSDGEGSQQADIQIRIESGAGKEGEEKEGKDGEEEGQEGKESDKAGQDKPKGSKGQGKGEKTPGEARPPKDIDSALEALKEACGEVGKTKKAAAAENTQTEAANAGVGEDPSQEVDTPDTIGGGIGSEKGVIEVQKTANCVDKNFTNRVKMSVRKLRTLILDRMAGHKKVGRLHLPTVIAAEQRNMLPRKPFISSVEDLVDAPVACVVATDFSSSTSGINHKLNDFSHNALYALQAAGCECAEVVWNTGASITKTIDMPVSAVRANQHNSDGGTSLVAASQGCVESLKFSRAQRKVAFIFTDGAVYENEVPMLSKNLRDNGFEACLLVSLGDVVKHSGIVDTECCSDIGQLVGVFDRWVRKQAAKAAQAQYA